MHTLQNPRHETFALHLAQGATPEAAYRAAGFSDNNRKTRSQDLAHDPDIASRVVHLRACIPHIEELRHRFAPSLLLMPQTKDELLAWLWQVMNSTRQVLPLQLRAATLFARLNGWHLHPKTPAQADTTTAASPTPQAQDPSIKSIHPSISSIQSDPPPAPLAPEERHLLAHLSTHTIANDLVQRPVYPKDIHPFYSTMADIALLQKPQSPPNPAPLPERSADTPVRIFPVPVTLTTSHDPASPLNHPHHPQKIPIANPSKPTHQHPQFPKWGQNHHHPQQPPHSHLRPAPFRKPPPLHPHPPFPYSPPPSGPSHIHVQNPAFPALNQHTPPTQPLDMISPLLTYP